MNKTITEVSKELHLAEKDIIDFLVIRNFILKQNDKYYPTVLGKEKGVVTWSSDVVGITEEGFERIRKAFTPEFTQAEIEQIDAIVSRINQGGYHD